MTQLRSGRQRWKPTHTAGLDLSDKETGWRISNAESVNGMHDLVRMLKHSGGVIALWTLVCMASAFTYLNHTTPEYVATTQVVLEPRRSPVGGSDMAANVYGSTLDSAQADSQVQVAKSERTLRFVFDALDLANDAVFSHQEAGMLARLQALLGVHARPDTVDVAQRETVARAQAFQSFSDRIGVRRIGQSYILEISFRAPQPALAAKLANSLTAAYIRDNIVYGAAAMQRGSELLQERVAEIQTEQDAAANAVQTGILPAIAFPDSEARIVSAALTPLNKAYPQTRLIYLLAGIFGLLSGSSASIAYHSLDRTIRNRRHIGRVFNLDQVSVVPLFRRNSALRSTRGALSFTSVMDVSDSDFAEALRVLRTVLLTAKTASRHTAIGIVSWLPGEGRTSIASNLALLVAASNESVVLIDADFRSPALSRALAPDAMTGLDEVLLSEAAGSSPLAVSLNGMLDILPAVAAGKTSNPNVFVGSSKMAEMLRTIRENSYVIFDLPPLSTSSDAQALAHLLDGVILVVEADRATYEHLNEALDLLRGAEASVICIVLNKVRPSVITRS